MSNRDSTKTPAVSGITKIIPIKKLMKFMKSESFSEQKYTLGNKIAHPTKRNGIITIRTGITIGNSYQRESRIINSIHYPTCIEKIIRFLPKRSVCEPFIMISFLEFGLFKNRLLICCLILFLWACWDKVMSWRTSLRTCYNSFLLLNKSKTDSKSTVNVRGITKIIPIINPSIFKTFELL